MSLNCLTCSHVLQRTDSYKELFPEEEYKGVPKKVDRNWSGGMTSPICDLPKPATVANIKVDHRRTVSFSGSGPRLNRSSGMRRDWSFENLAENQDQIVSCH